MIRWPAVMFLGSWSFIFLLAQTRCAVCHKWHVSLQGTDSRRCGSQASPCGTLRHTADVANNGDLIYLDGRGSGKRPYGCEKPTALPEERTWGFINKSLSVSGVHERAYLACDHGLRFKTPAGQKSLNVSLNNLAFVGKGTRFYGDCSVSIFNCTFASCFFPLEMSGTILTLFLKMSLFEKNTNCVKVLKRYKPRKRVGAVSVDISDVVFKNNHIQPSKSQTGMIHISNSCGMTAIKIRNSLFQENYAKGVRGWKRGHVITVKSDENRVGQLRILNSSFISISNGVLVTGCLNMRFANLTFISNGRALWLIFSSINGSSAFVALEDSLFSNNSAGFFLQLSVNQDANVTVQIRNCLFNESRHQLTTQRPAVKFLEKSESFVKIYYEISLINVTFRSIRGAALLLSNFASNRKLRVNIENSLFLDNENINYYNRTGYIVHIKMTRQGKISCRSSKLASQIHFRNTRFEENKAYFGLIFLSNVHASFVNCYFMGNYFLSAEGSVINHGEGRGILTVIQGTFLQSRIPQEEKPSKIKMTKYPTFISSNNKGELVIENSTFVTSETSPFYPVLTAIKENSVKMDSSTEIRCPVSTILKFNYWTRPQNILGYEKSCRKNVSTLKVFCENCPMGTYSLEHGRSTGLKTNQSECQPCPYGATCLDGIKAKPNFWGYEKHPSNLTFVPCPLEYCWAVRNSSNVSNYNGCQGHRTGTLCGGCVDGYSEELCSTRCREKSRCHDDWFWVVTVAYSVAFVFFLIFRQPLVSFLWHQTFWYKRPSEEAFKPQETHVDHGYLKIIFYFYQVAELLLVKDPGDLLYTIPFFSTWFNLFNFRLLYLFEKVGCPLPGLTAVTKELFMCSSVFITMGCTVLIFLIHKGINQICGKKKPSLNFYLAVVMEILLLGYERLADTTLSLLHCVPIGPKWHLFLDGNVQCWQWWQIGLTAYIIVFVAPFIVVLYFGSLSLYRNKVSATEFLGACALPLPFLVHWAVQHVRKNNTMQPDSSDGEEIKEILHETFRTPTEEDNGTVYWESILIGRRFILVCLHSFIADHMFRLMSLDCACVLILVHHILKRPYRNFKVNVCETMSLLALVAIATFNLADAVLMSAGVEAAGPNEDRLQVLEWVEVILLGFLPAALSLLVTFAFLSQLCRLTTVIIRGFQKMIDIYGSRGFGNDEQQQPLLYNS